VWGNSTEQRNTVDETDVAQGLNLALSTSSFNQSTDTPSGEAKWIAVEPIALTVHSLSTMVQLGPAL
jgi:hypothetical protein